MQCCQSRSLPTKLGYFEIACRGPKNCWAGGLKLGYFSSVCLWQLFFFKFDSFPLDSESFEPFYVEEHSFSSISGIKTSWRAINSDYPLLAEINNLIVFPPNWVILVILRFKNTQILKIGCMIIWQKVNYFAAGKKANLAWFGPLKLWQHYLDVVHGSVW